MMRCFLKGFVVDPAKLSMRLCFTLLIGRLCNRTLDACFIGYHDPRNCLYWSRVMVNNKQQLFSKVLSQAHVGHYQ